VSFSRSFLLPEAVDPADVDARYENGVLHIHVRRRVKR
jgi:HSP20 family molecular chaperone IbpA